VLVWDRFVRFFHWGLVSSFGFSYLTGEEGEMLLHSWSGYFIFLLLIMRMVWGFIGSEYARFSSFLFSPRMSLLYVWQIIKGAPAHFVGHNPAGAVMVFALMLSLMAILISGFVLYAGLEFEGPLLFLNPLSDGVVSFVKMAHEYLVEFVLILVALHITGVVLASVQHKENLAKAMVTGRKQAK
jgi:cytochrome b